MNKRPIDRSKKSNIKCEHCQFWDDANIVGNDYRAQCLCKDSPKHGNVTNYWNRCKAFEWEEKETKC